MRLPRPAQGAGRLVGGRAAGVRPCRAAGRASAHAQERGGLRVGLNALHTGPIEAGLVVRDESTHLMGTHEPLRVVGSGGEGNRKAPAGCRGFLLSL